MFDPLSTSGATAALARARAANDGQTTQAIRQSREFKKACAMFESYFLHLMWREGRKTVPDSGLIPVNRGEQIFRDLLDQAVADESVKSRSMGLADMLEQQLTQAGRVTLPSRHQAQGGAGQLTPPAGLANLTRAARASGYIRGPVPNLDQEEDAGQTGQQSSEQAQGADNARAQTGSQAREAAQGSAGSQTDYSGRVEYEPPLEGRISSVFGMRVHPISGRLTHHDGLDVAAPSGTSIRAAAGGEVVESGWVGGYGNLVEILHPDGTSTRYGHCQDLKVKPGQVVAQGQVIATVGSTGRSTGPHLHFEIRDELGKPKDPLSMVAMGHGNQG